MGAKLVRGVTLCNEQISAMKYDKNKQYDNIHHIVFESA